MKQLLTEKILLEEPVQDDELSNVPVASVVDDKGNEVSLPDVEVEAPVVSEEEIKVDSDMKENMITNILSNEINDAYNNISMLKGDITMVSQELPERTDILDVLNAIIDERAIHIGMLQKVLETINQKQADLIETGKEEAEAIASEPEANELNKE